MNLLAPAFLGFLALLPVIVVLHILRARHQQHEVPSTRHWRGIASDLEGRPAWRVPRLSLLLLLQLLVVAALAIALARPAETGGTKRQLVIVLDAAVSMQATDEQPSRFERAKQEARTLISGLQSGDGVTLVRAARGPAILAEATADEPNAVLSALASATASPGPSDMFSALALATSLAGLHADARTEVVVLSDGVFPKIDLGRLGAAQVDLRLQAIGNSPNNLAITEFSLRPMLGSQGRQVAFVRASNFGDSDVEVPLRALGDGLLIETRRVKLPANGAVELAINLPAGTRLAEVQLDTEDDLRLDDHAQALVPSTSPLEVTLVSANPSYWDRALRAFTQIKVTTVAPTAYQPPNTGVVILDGFQPPVAQWPSANVLLVNPRPPAATSSEPAPVTALGEVQGAQIVRADRNSAILAGVDLTSMSLPASLRLKLPVWGHSIADTSAGPLIFEGTYAGRRMVVVGFDPAQTDLSQRLAFPILISNALNRLSPDAVPLDVQPGDVVDIPPLGGATEVQVHLPSGKVQALRTDGATVRFSQTEAIGSYSIVYRQAESVVGQQTFVVNATNESASNIRPNPSALGDGLANATALGVGEPVQHEVWPYVLATGLVLLSVEWWYYCRRRT